MNVSTKAILAYRSKNDGERALLLQVVIDRKPVRFPLGWYVKPKDFVKGKIRNGHPNQADINLVIEKNKARVTEIWSRYHLSQRVLSPELLRREFNSYINRQDFIAFARQAVEVQRQHIDFRTYQQNVFALDKLEAFKSPMLFSDMTEELVIKYTAFEKKKYGNSPNTIAKTLITWKKYLRIAKKEGIQFNNPFEFYKVRTTKSFKVSLSQSEVHQLFEYFASPNCPEDHQHVLRYFLFSCRTGLRISDITRLKWEQIQEEKIVMPMYKGRSRKAKTIEIPITKERHLLPTYNPENETVFECYADAVTNRKLKDIGNRVGIKKKLEYHMSRHTFATTFLEGGGTVEVLKELMVHEDIKTTMVYVHMTDARKREQKEKAFSY